MTNHPNRKPATDVSGLVGRRIEIPVHYDAWMRGARFGLVTAFRRGRAGLSDYVTVQMDHPQIRRALKLWALDWDYAKIID